MSEMRKYSAGRWYTCKPHGARGVFYIFWSEGRRSRRKSTGTSSLAAAQAFFDEWLTLTATAPEDATCEELYRLKYPKQANERADYAWKHLAPAFGALMPLDVTQARENAYIAGRQAAGAAPSTIRAELSMLRASWNDAVRRRILPSTALPVLDRLPPASPPRTRWLRDGEVDALLAAAEAWGRRPYLFLMLALNTAARRTAICELTWDQVDWDTGQIHYLPDGAVQTRKRKASVPMSANLRVVLEEAFETRKDAYVIGAGGKINQTITRVAKAAGVEGVTPHVMRHTAATRMARRGVALWIIAKVLGNTVEQVERVYAKWQPDMAAAAVETING